MVFTSNTRLHTAASSVFLQAAMPMIDVNVNRGSVLPQAGAASFQGRNALDFTDGCRHGRKMLHCGTTSFQT